MSGRSRGHGNSRRGGWVGGWQDDSTANGGWSGHGASWSGGAHADWWSVPFVYVGGTTPIAQTPDTDLNQMWRNSRSRGVAYETVDGHLSRGRQLSWRGRQSQIFDSVVAGNSRRDQTAVNNAGAPTAVAAASIAQPLDTHSTQVASQPESALQKPVVGITWKQKVTDGIPEYSSGTIPIAQAPCANPQSIRSRKGPTAVAAAGSCLDLSTCVLLRL